MTRLLRFAIAVALLLVAAALLTRPAGLSVEPGLPSLPGDLDAYVARSEMDAGRKYPLYRGTEKRIRWQEPGSRTPWAVVYLPGFSATRQEIAPVPELVADALGANLFETRLRGHGRIAGELRGVTAEDWIADAGEALAVGARLGDRVIVIGTSTGATLALAMAGSLASASVDALVLVSPNFAPADPRARWLTAPAGPLLARLIEGETRRWTPHNELQARYWSTVYPVAAAVEVMRLVDFVQASLPLQLETGLLVFQSPNDTVVSPSATALALTRISAGRQRIVSIESAGDPANHVLAGDILSQEHTAEVAAAIVDFVTGDGS